MTKMIDCNKIKKFLKQISSVPHIAASQRDVFITNWIKERWTKFGVDKVKLETYEYLLSYPDSDNPNKIFLTDEEGKSVFKSRHMEDALREEDKHKDFIHAFHAFSPAGNVTGELVYINFGRKEDIKHLQKLGISMKGKIALARYGNPISVFYKIYLNKTCR